MTRVAALLFGCLMTAAACTGDTGGMPGPAPGPAPATSSATSTAARTWAGLPVGSRPEIPYVRRNRYRTPGGMVVELPADDRGISGVVPFSGGLLVSDTAYFEGTNGIALVKHGGRLASWPSAGRCSSGGPVASVDGEHVAWATVRCPESPDRAVDTVHVARVNGSGEVTQAVGPGGLDLVGFLDRRLVYNVGFQDGAWITDLEGPPRRVPGVDRVQAVSQAAERLIGQVGDRPRLVLDVSGSVRWRARRGDLVSFSPDGTRVLSILTSSRVSVVRTRNGRSTASFSLPAGAEVWSMVWETNQTLLPLMRYDGRVAVVRVFLDGRLERVTPAVRADTGDEPYVLLEPPPVDAER